MRYLDQHGKMGESTFIISEGSDAKHEWACEICHCMFDLLLIITLYSVPNSCKEYSKAKNQMLLTYVSVSVTPDAVCHWFEPADEETFTFSLLLFFLFFPFFPLLFNNDCVRQRQHLLMGCVVDNVVYIFGVTPPLKLLQAYQITLTNSHATTNISPNLSQLATFSVCLKRLLTGFSIIRIARQKQIRLLHAACIVRCIKWMYCIGHALNSLNVLLIMTLPCAFWFSWKWFSRFSLQ